MEGGEERIEATSAVVEFMRLTRANIRSDGQSVMGVVLTGCEKTLFGINGVLDALLYHDQKIITQTKWKD